MIGQRAPGDVCAACIALRLAAGGPGGVVSVVSGGWAGGWDSGACAAGELSAAADIVPGDVLSHDGQLVTVTDTRRGTWWLAGGHGPGVAIGWRSQAGSASGVLFRADSDLLARVARDGGTA